MLNYYDLGIAFPIKMNHLLSEDSLKLIESSESSEQSEPEKPHCLIFAADENIRVLYKTLLEIWNYEVTETTAAEETIRHIERRRPDIILMDTQINLSASLHVMQSLKAREPSNQIPFVLLSGHAQPEIRRLVIAAGAKDFCVKPVDFNVLENVLKNCLESETNR